MLIIQGSRLREPDHCHGHVIAIWKTRLLYAIRRTTAESLRCLSATLIRKQTSRYPSKNRNPKLNSAENNPSLSGTKHQVCVPSAILSQKLSASNSEFWLLYIIMAAYRRFSLCGLVFHLPLPVRIVFTDKLNSFLTLVFLQTFLNVNGTAIVYPTQNSQTKTIVIRMLRRRLIDFGKYNDSKAIKVRIMARNVRSITLLHYQGSHGKPDDEDSRRKTFPVHNKEKSEINKSNLFHL